MGDGDGERELDPENAFPRKQTTAPREAAKQRAPIEVFRMALPEPARPAPCALVAEVTALVRPPRQDGVTAAVAGRA